MKIMVPVKGVLDYEVPIKVLSDGSNVETKRVKTVINPFDETAVEGAVRLKEAGKATEVVAVSIGPESAGVQLRHAMAMGADRSILIKSDTYVDSDLASRLLAKVFGKEDYALVIMGKQSVDSDANQTAQLLAERLKLPQACFASKVEIEGGKAAVTREVDDGAEILRANLPCVISVDLSLNKPRLVTLSAILKAKRKPMETLSLNQLCVDGKAKVKILKMVPAPTRSGGRRVNSVSELVKALREEAGVI